MPIPFDTLRLPSISRTLKSPLYKNTISKLTKMYKQLEEDKKILRPISPLLHPLSPNTPPLSPLPPQSNSLPELPFSSRPVRTCLFIIRHSEDPIAKPNFLCPLD